MLHFFLLLTDSPGIPPSATAHELFRGFSFVAPALLGEDNHVRNPILDNQIALKSVSSDQPWTTLVIDVTVSYNE